MIICVHLLPPSYCHATLHPAAVRCDMVLHRVFRARCLRTNVSGGEVRHGVTSGVSRETSNRYVAPHLHRECHHNCHDCHNSRQLPLRSIYLSLSIICILYIYIYTYTAGTTATTATTAACDYCDYHHSDH